MPGVWKTKDGVEVPISQLDDRHLINICKMLIRNRVAAKKAMIHRAQIHKLRLRATPYQSQAAEFLLYLKKSDSLALAFEKHNDVFQELYDRELTRFIPEREIRMAIVEYFWVDADLSEPDLSDIFPDTEDHT